MQHAIKANRGAILRAVEQPHIKTDAPEFRPGDTVRVETKVVEGTRTRNQAFEGVVIAINGSCVNTAQNGALPIGVNPRDCFLFRVEYTTGDRLHVNARLGSTVVGTADSPGEIGGVGYTVDQGGSLIIGITPINPIPANFRIDITLHALEMRGSANFVGGR